MGNEITGTVRRLWKYGSGYDVKVVIANGEISFEVEMETGVDDPAEAIEATRRRLQHLGQTMARTFDRPESLR